MEIFWDSKRRGIPREDYFRRSPSEKTLSTTTIHHLCDSTPATRPQERARQTAAPSTTAPIGRNTDTTIARQPSLPLHQQKRLVPSALLRQDLYPPRNTLLFLANSIARINTILSGNPQCRVPNQRQCSLPLSTRCTSVERRPARRRRWIAFPPCPHRLNRSQGGVCCPCGRLHR